jgi:hypothetical protein
MARRLATLAVGAALLGWWTVSAGAAPRTVWFRLQLADDRYNCAAASETGARRPCNKGGYVDAVGHQVELWDKDDLSDDEYIGTWYIAGPGTQCITFEWENAPYSKGEPDPDLYLRYINVVNRSGYVNYVRVRAVRTDGSSHPVTTWRNGQPGDPDRYVARNCQAGTVCYIFLAGSLVPTNDVASERALRIMTLDSAQHALQVLGELMDRHVDLHYPGKASCTTSCTENRTEIHIRDSQGGDGILAAHEMGHAIQMQEFNRDDLRNDCSKNGGGWTVPGDEYESCATQEGFASYVGVVSWYDPNNFGTVPIGWGLDFDRATPQVATCSGNKGIPLQVAKAFWDLDDWNNESGAGGASAWSDALRYGTEDIVRGWRQFGSGTGNRQDFESGNDGVNMRDYYWNNVGRFTAPGFFETFLQHTCLQDQADD